MNEIQVVARPHPFSGERIDFTVEEGHTLTQILEQAQPDPMFMQTTHVWINGTKIERRYWGSVRPKAGTGIVVAVDAPEGGGGDGGGKNIFRTILTIVVIAAAMWVTGGMAGVLAPGMLTGTTAALAGAAVPVTGMMLVNR